MSEPVDARIIDVMGMLADLRTVLAVGENETVTEIMLSLIDALEGLVLMGASQEETCGEECQCQK